jgi:MOSC domain-containing protein YiiM
MSDGEEAAYAGLARVFPREGRLEWIGLRSRQRGPVEIVAEATAEAGRGLVGDRALHAGSTKRQVTLIQAEDFATVAALLGSAPPAPELLRRNLVVSGINLQALKHRRFRIGPVLLEGTDDCHPCSRMEENLGPGGYNAMRGHGGITARVLEGGVLRRGDAVRAEP